MGSHDPENVLEIFFFSSHVELLKEPPGKKILDLTKLTLSESCLQRKKSQLVPAHEKGKVANSKVVACFTGNIWWCYLVYASGPIISSSC